MKKYIFGLSMMALGMLFASCSDNLDEQPDSRWIHIDSSDKVAKLLTSGYPSSVPAVICELMGDNLVDNNVVVPATHNDAYSLFHEEAYKWEVLQRTTLPWRSGTSTTLASLPPTTPFRL